ncbi:MAG TPA: hypothetical protein VES42_03955 [Pilimelia sp.]|nr:hypothetical protein [Pilimelia sp.]
MSSLEDALREAFARRVAALPGLDDPAGRAIRHARAARRRRAVGSGFAAGVALLLLLGGALRLHGWWLPGPGRPPVGPVALPSGAEASDVPAPTPAQPFAFPGERDERTAAPRQATPGPTFPPPALGLDLRVGDELWTVEGDRVPLTGAGQVTRVYRVPAGWVYGGADTVRLLRRDGRSSVPLAAVDGPWAISPDGTRLALVAGRELQVREVGEAGLRAGVAVAVPADAEPVAFAGDHVVISGGDAARFDSLDPAGPYRPTWSDTVLAVYGGAGAAATGLVRGPKRGTVCLARLRPERTGLAVAKRGGCRKAADLAPQPHAVSPGGRWLAERGATSVRLRDLPKTFAEKPPGGGASPDARGDVAASTAKPVEEPVVTCPTTGSVAPAWADGETLLTAARDQVIRCRTDGGREVVALPPEVGVRWAFVPDLTAEPVP